MSNMPFATCSRRWPLLHSMLRNTMVRAGKQRALPKRVVFMIKGTKAPEYSWLHIVS